MEICDECEFAFPKRYIINVKELEHLDADGNSTIMKVGHYCPDCTIDKFEPIVRKMNESNN